MWAYLRYVERPGIAGYIPLVLFFALGLMAKPMLVTLPFVLLLLDYWPLERFAFSQLQNRKSTAYRLIAEKLPLFILVAVSSVITLLGEAVISQEAIPLTDRIGNTIVSYATYIGKMFWPSGLAVFYPHPADSLSIVKVTLCAVLLVFLTVCFLYFGRQKKYLAVGWLWFVGTLVPVIGLVQVGAQARADRYTYIPLTGLFIIIAWGVSDLALKRRYRKVVLGILSVTALAALSICTSFQLGYWRESVTLFERALDVAGSSFIMHNNYGNILKDMGRGEEAIEEFKIVLNGRPDDVEMYCNLGIVLQRAGRKALRINPEYKKADKLLKAALAGQKKNR